MGVLSSLRRRSNQTDGDLSHLSTNRQSSQLPMLNLADNGRNNLIAVIGEFVGTFMFLFWSFAGTQISNTPMPRPGSNPNTSNLLYASLAFGFSLTVNVWAFYRVTGGLFNPSVSSSFLPLTLPRYRSFAWLISMTGYISSLPRRRSPSNAQYLHRYCSNLRRYLRCSRGIRFIPRSSQRCNHTRWWCQYRTGSLH